MVITKTMDIIVPLPRKSPIDEILGSDDKNPIKRPAEASIVPEVTTVGKAWFKASTMASLGGMVCFRSWKRPVIIMA